MSHIEGNQIVSHKIKLFFKYFLVFILVIYAGNATVFVRSLNTWENIGGLAFISIIIILYALYYKILLNRKFLVLFFFYVIYFIFLTIKFKEIHPRFFGIYLLSFYIAYVTISILRFNFFIYFHKILYYLSIVSLIFWIIQVLLPEQITNFLDIISFSEPGSGNVRSNIILYTINLPYSMNSNKIFIGGVAFIRNAGFAWEPGAFSVFISLAIFINLILNRFSLKRNREFWIFFFSLITTFSTTGYFILILLSLFYIYNQNFGFKLLLFPLIITIGFYIITLPFMGDKVIEVSQQDTEMMIEHSIQNETNYHPQRITSFLIDFQDFKNNPVLGYGGHQKERWTKKLGADISSISGIGKLLAKFGLIGAIFFFINLIISSKFLTNIFRFKGWIFMFLLFFLISISYSLIEHPLLMCFWMFSFFHTNFKTIKISKKLSFSNNFNELKEKKFTL